MESWICQIDEVLAKLFLGYVGSPSVGKFVDIFICCSLSGFAVFEKIPKLGRNGTFALLCC